jgi:predicted site-specific integrase-resolvase
MVMRLSQYAKTMGVSYKTAFRWWKAGRLDAYQLETGTIIVRDPVATEASPNVALYARVSSNDQKEDLERQVQRLKDYAASRGYQVTKVVSELASGLNDTRPKFLKLLTDPSIGIIVVEHRDRATRFGFHYIEQLLQMQGRRIEVIFPREIDHDLVEDFIAVITSMVSRIYGRRTSKRRAEKIKQCVEQVMKQEGEERDGNGGPGI